MWTPDANTLINDRYIVFFHSLAQDRQWLAIHAAGPGGVKPDPNIDSPKAAVRALGERYEGYAMDEHPEGFMVLDVTDQNCLHGPFHLAYTPSVSIPAKVVVT